jgi:hypothetical protein
MRGPTLPQGRVAWRAEPNSLAQHCYPWTTISTSWSPHCLYMPLDSTDQLEEVLRQTCF